MEFLDAITIKSADTKTHPSSLWDLVKFEASNSDEVLGFICVSFIPSSRIRLEGIDQDILAYLKISTGKGCGIVPRSYTTLEMADEKLVVAIEYGINETLHGWTFANQRKTLPVTKAERVDRIRKSLPEITDRFDAERCAFLEFHVDKPMVDMVEVNPRHRRQGIGLELYAKAASWAKEQGMNLHASKIQTAEGRAVWGSLLRRGLVDPDGPGLQDKAPDARPRIR